MIQEKIKNSRQTVWSHNNSYYVCSTSLDGSEVMVFDCDSEGNVVSYHDLYVAYDRVNNHTDHMLNFAKGL